MPLDWQHTLDWTPTAVQVEQFETFYQALLNVNQSLNLTRITERQDFWEKHLWDSLSGLRPWFSPEQRGIENLKTEPIQTVIDIGTGGGFPGIPAAIAFPQWFVVLLDSTQKKVQSLSQLASAVGLENVHPICDRAEQLGHHSAHRAHYDLALIRAVATPAVCAEYALPFLKEQGVGVLYRGQWSADDETSLQRALQALGGEIIHVQPLTTPLSEGDRHCVYVKKIEPTPQAYPRRVGVPTRKPLG